MKSYYKFSNNEYRPVYINIVTNFCDGMNSVFQKYLFNMFGNYTNIFQPCPLWPGEYYIKNFNFAAQHLPSIIPAGRYLVNTSAYTQSNDWLFNTSVYFYIAKVYWI